MADDIEAGRRVSWQHIAKWRPFMHTSSFTHSTTTPSQRMMNLISKFEEETFLSGSELDVDGGNYVEYIQAEFLRRSEVFGRVLLPTAANKNEKIQWLLKAAGELYDCMIDAENFNIAEAVLWLQSKGTLQTPTESEEERHYLCTELVFTLVGLITMLYSPRLAKPGERKLCIERVSLDNRSSFEQYTHDAVDAREADRPLRDMLLGFGDLRPRYAIEAGETTPVLSSHFNGDVFASIGRMRFAWTDLLPAHLDFDVASRTLYIFQRPTFCLLNIPKESTAYGQTYKSLLGSCLGGMDSSGTAMDQNMEEEYMKEIILSIHMIFGQSTKSRKLFCTRKVSNRRSRNAPDPFLTILCTRPWPFSAWSHQPRKRYFFHEEFPLLSRKLEVINNYLQQKQPGNIWLLWKDKRNPMQWWTFWAVVIIGGCGLILAAVQTGLSAAQLYYTMNNPPNDSSQR